MYAVLSAMSARSAHKPMIGSARGLVRCDGAGFVSTAY